MNENNPCLTRMFLFGVAAGGAQIIYSESTISPWKNEAGQIMDEVMRRGCDE